MKIAIIGGGIAGLGALWRLSEIHDVTLYEAEPSLGGHAQTVSVEVGHASLYADLAVQLFAERIHPNLFALFKDLEIETYVAPVSFVGYFPYHKQSWDNRDLSSTDLGKSLFEECDRFQARLCELSNQPIESLSDISLGDFLKNENFSDTFVANALMPMLSILAGTRASLTEFALTYCMALFNMGLLSFFSPPQWRRTRLGVQNHIQKLKNISANRCVIKQGVSVMKLTRKPDKIIIHDSHGDIQKYDQAIFATHADTALKIIENPSDEERKLLGHFVYHRVASVLHKDPCIFKGLNDYEKSASCIYRYAGKNVSLTSLGSTTFHVNAYRNQRNFESPVFVTIDPQEDIDPCLIITTKHWKLPKLRPVDLKIKREIGQIQGKEKIWFCGMDTATTGHESSFVSGLVIAERLGASYPFPGRKAAESFFSNLKTVMGM